MANGNPARKSLVNELFPSGLPRLWCPLLTHYTDDSGLDEARMAEHIRSIRPWVSVFLVPGSTGDGWELSASETDSLLDVILAEAGRQDFSVMIGVLRTVPGHALEAIRGYLHRFTIGAPMAKALSARRICGFTVTPPKGAGLPQEAMFQELEAIAQTGVPLAVYQLPQITENEMSPETVARLALLYPNLYLLKDTSGHDRIALSGVDTGDLFMVRGAEGDYSRWLKTSSIGSTSGSSTGKYDGFLLSTANCFARELSTVLDYVAAGKLDEAGALSARISAVVGGVFSLAGGLAYGNPFSNANKAMDHCLAWGSSYAAVPLPMTHSGNRLPGNLIEQTARLMDQYGFMKTKGYME
jgi:dihydrodipicolinate synthase/N-acetylneuraminate lyase